MALPDDRHQRSVDVSDYSELSTEDNSNSPVNSSYSSQRLAVNCRYLVLVQSSQSEIQIQQITPELLSPRLHSMSKIIQYNKRFTLNIVSFMYLQNLRWLRKFLHNFYFFGDLFIYRCQVFASPATLLAGQVSQWQINSRTIFRDRFSWMTFYQPVTVSHSVLSSQHTIDNSLP